MNAYLRLLKNCGIDSVKFGGLWYCDPLETPLTDDELKAYALEVGAKEAAKDFPTWGPEYCGNEEWRIIEGGFWTGRWGLFSKTSATRYHRSYSNLELIQEATKAGWEKAEGL